MVFWVGEEEVFGGFVADALVGAWRGLVLFGGHDGGGYTCDEDDLLGGRHGVWLSEQEAYVG